MTSDPAAKWDARYRDRGVGEQAPLPLLTEFAHLLPRAGEALDLACGLGANALYLAGRGLRVEAWDISPVAIDKLTRYVHDRRLPIQARLRDLVATQLPPHSLDLIVVAHFLHRPLLPTIAAALRPGGLLFYQTFTREKSGERGPHDPAHLLEPNELLHSFAALRIVYYREEGQIGEPGQGVREVAQIIASRT